MNFKRYHESKNLLDESMVQQGYYGTQAINYNVLTADNKYRSFVKNLKAGTYTLNITADETMYILRCNNDIDGSINVYSNPPYTFTLSADTTIYVSWRNTNTTNSFTNMAVMLNAGSQPLPYEPYSSEVWHNIPHYIHNTSTDTLTTLPAVLYPNDTTATVGLKGQAVQSGTPTRDNPIMPQGTGERTANLCNPNLTRYEKAYGVNGIVDFSGGATYLLPIEATKTYTVKIHSDEPIGVLRVGLYNEDTPITGTYVISLQEKLSLSNPTATITNRGYKYLYVQITGSYINQYGLSHVMVNIGNTALPFEPYGYKIPISSADTTTPVYLGEVETTRRIKKLVLTGHEAEINKNVSADTNYLYWLRIPNDQSVLIGARECICTHLSFVSYAPSSTAAISTSGTRVFYLNFGADIMNAQTSGNTVEGMREYLAAQYAAGTPVCVWYVLATETTGIVNEPLRKIGDYADSVSGITIPTITGKDTFDVLTTLKPSEVSLAYTGWHDATVEEWDGSEWQ